MGPRQAEIDTQLANVRTWMKPEPRNTHLMFTPGHTEVRREPFGVVLVIAPFNYPFFLTIVPIVGALAAGNVVVLKPSELSVHTSKWLAKFLPQYLSSEAFAVVEGAIPETTALLNQRWDFIFFTGSFRVGAIVSKAAAKFCTPLVMELGGKAPVVIDKSVASLREAAKRLTMGKFINSGQTCMAPDYVLCHESLHAKFTAEVLKCVEEFYSKDPKNSSEYGRMCTEAHAARMKSLMETSGGKMLCGGPEKVDLSARFVPPTVIDRPALDSPVLTDEIFGPLLPILTFNDTNEVIERINSIDATPLCYYIFSTNARTTEKLLNGVQSGDAIVNDTFIHAANPSVPFGGVGSSGHGNYKGRLSYECFT